MALLPRNNIQVWGNGCEETDAEQGSQLKARGRLGPGEEGGEEKEPKVGRRVPVAARGKASRTSCKMQKMVLAEGQFNLTKADCLLNSSGACWSGFSIVARR